MQEPVRRGTALVRAALSLGYNPSWEPEFSTALGLPSWPVPFLWPGTTASTPKLNLFKQVEADGIAKFAATVSDTRTGKAWDAPPA